VELIDTFVTPQPSRRRHRLVPGPLGRRRLIAFAVALAAVAGVALLLTNQRGPTPRRPTAAKVRAILRGAAAGLAVPAGAVLHTADTGLETFSTGGWTRWSDELWQETSYPYDQRIIRHVSFSSTHPVSQEWAIVDNVMQLYYPDRNTIYANEPAPYTIRPGTRAGRYLLTPTDAKNPPTITITANQLRGLREGQDTIIWTGSHQVSVVPYRSILHQSFLVSIRKTALALLRSGRAQVLYDVQFAGRAAIEISRPGPIPVIRREIYYVAPRTYQPLGLVQRVVGETTTTRFTTYRLLPGTVANRALVTLVGAHPSARVDTTAADYNAAANRIFK
jgi:hypothetical protein